MSQHEFDVVMVAFSGEDAAWPQPRREYRRIEIDNLGVPDESGATADEIYYAPGENLGWVKAANIGLAMSTAPHVVLMNDDCTVKCPDWLFKLREGFGPRVAAVGPATDYNCPQNKDNLIRPYFRPREWNLSFFCVMFSREALIDVGYLDERFGIGLCEDDDWQMRAREKGWEVAVNGEVFVSHKGHQSWPSMEARNALHKENKLKMAEKWGEKWSGW